MIYVHCYDSVMLPGIPAAWKDATGKGMIKDNRVINFLKRMNKVLFCPGSIHRVVVDRHDARGAKFRGLRSQS